MMNGKWGIGLLRAVVIHHSAFHFPGWCRMSNMKRRFGDKPRHQQRPRQDNPRGPQPRGRHRSSQRIDRGPKTCPMCGAVVGDLGAHIRQRHDDAQSHPRD